MVGGFGEEKVVGMDGNGWRQGGRQQVAARNRRYVVNEQRAARRQVAYIAPPEINVIIWVKNQSSMVGREWLPSSAAHIRPYGEWRWPRRRTRTRTPTSLPRVANSTFNTLFTVLFAVCHGVNALPAYRNRRAKK